MADRPDRAVRLLDEDPQRIHSRADTWHDYTRHADTTPLHTAAFHDRAELARELLVRGADPMARDGSGRTARDIAVDLGHSTVVAVLGGGR